MNALTLTTVIEPRDAAYDEARAAWNLQADQRPAAVVTATSVAQVQEAVAYATARGLKVAPQVTGHLAAAMPSLESALLLKIKLDERVVIDADARTARVPAGAVWEDVAVAAAARGFAVLHGSAPDVGVVGYLVGGGMSFYGRKHGLASNHVRAIELVTAGGELRRVDAQRDADLFWAVRGGGGSFGVVTAIEIELFDIKAVYAGATFWPVEQAREVLGAWLDWCATAPEGVTTSARILCLPPVPDVPEPLRLVPVVSIDGVVCEDPQLGESLVAAFRGVGTPILDHWALMPPEGIIRLHGDPEIPVPGIGDHALLGDLDEAALDAFLAVTGAGSGSPLLAAELRQLGGAFSRAPADAGARSDFEGSFALFGVGVPMDPALVQPIHERLEMLLDAMHPWATGTVYMNFAEQPEATAERAFPPEVYARLCAIRATYDPRELFVAPHRIPAANVEESAL